MTPIFNVFMLNLRIAHKKQHKLTKNGERK